MVNLEKTPSRRVLINILIKFQLSLSVLWSVFAINSAIVTLSSSSTSLAESVKKEKRGIFGFGVHGHHHNYPPHYDDYPPPIPHHHQTPGPPFVPPPPPLPPAPVNLGAHFHTTVTKKIGVPIPYPYPVKVSIQLCNSLSLNLQNISWIFMINSCNINKFGTLHPTRSNKC